MLTLIAAAAVAAAQPAAASAHAQHQMPTTQMGKSGEHGSMKRGMDCSKDCCKHMAKKHEGESAGHAEHKDR